MISSCSHEQLSIMLLSKSEAFNVKSEQAVETYKCLYDRSPDYSSRDEQDKAWKYVAQKFSSTGMCLDKMYNIFSCLVSGSQKKVQSNTFDRS